MATNLVSDSVVMPDKYNTGVPDGTELLDISDRAINGGWINLDKTLMDYLAPLGHSRVETDGSWTFTGLKTVNASVRMAAGPYTSVPSVRIENCFFDTGTLSNMYCLTGNMHYGTGESWLWDAIKPIYVDHCTFTGKDSRALVNAFLPFVMSNCKGYDFGSDAFPSTNPVGKRINLYGWNGGILEGAHADFIQTAGHLYRLDSDFPKMKAYFEQKLGSVNPEVYIRNCRSDLIQYQDETGQVYLSNASSYNDCDYGDIVVDIDTMYATGGGKPFQFNITEAPSGTTISGTAKNLIAGCIYGFDIVGANGGSNNKVYYDVAEASTILVGSVWKGTENVYLSVTNYTNQQRNFTIKTNIGEIQKSIIASPTQSDISSSYYPDTCTWYPKSWESFPFDRLYTIPSSGVEWVQVYDGDTLVRTQVFEENDPIVPDIPVNPDEPTYNDLVVVKKSLIDAVADGFIVSRGLDSKLTLTEMAGMASIPLGNDGIIPSGVKYISENGMPALSVP